MRGKLPILALGALAVVAPVMGSIAIAAPPDLGPQSPVSPVKAPPLTAAPQLKALTTAPAATSSTSPAPQLDPPSAPPTAAAPGSLTEHPLVTDPGPQSPISVSIDPTGAMYVLVSDGRDNSLAVYMLDPTGARLWSQRVIGRSGVVVAARDGAIVVVDAAWTYVQRYDRTGHAQFATPVSLGQTNGGDFPAATVAYDGAGGVFVAFQPYGPAGGAGRIIKRVDRNGTIVFSTASLGANAALVHDGSGNVIVGSSGADVATYKFSSTGAQLWSTPATSVYGAKWVGRGVPDGRGGAVFAWVDARRGPVAQDLYAHGVDGSGHMRWATNGIEVARDSWVYDLAEDGSAGAWAAWCTRDGHAKVVRLGGAGAPAFAAVDLGVGACGLPSIARDGAGALVSTKVTDGANAYAVARLDGAGRFSWPDQVKRFGTAQWLQPQMARVAASQPVVFFTDTRTGYSDVYFWR
jgi:hypothetical protein